MTLKERIHGDMIQAMKDRDVFKKNLLGVLLSELDRKGKTPSDTEVIAVVKKMIKNAEETASTSMSSEISILAIYLPKAMDESQIEELVKGVIADNPTLKIGPLTGICVKKSNGQANPSTITNIIKRVLDSTK
jgi:hypothetical protein